MIIKRENAASERRASKYNMKKPSIFKLLATVICFALFDFSLAAQVVSDSLPVIDYSSADKTYVIEDIAVSGVPDYDNQVVIGISGLEIGQEIVLPGGPSIPKAIRSYWKNGLFSDVGIEATKIVGNKIWLNIRLQRSPRISEIVFEGLKKSERQEIETKIGLLKGLQITPNSIGQAKIIIQKHFEDKGFKNVEVVISLKDDISKENEQIVTVYVDKKTKIKVHEIIIDGNKALSEIKIEKAMKKTSETGKLRNLFKSKKFIPEEYENDKNLIIEKYNELGYRDAQILKDSVFPFSEKTVDIYMKIEEGDKYYIRDIKWVGNTIYDTNVLSALLRVKPKDVYNQKLLMERLQGGPNDQDAVANLYTNNGYLVAQVMPTEVNVENDSVDLEIRVFEGKQFPINKIEIQGNDRLFEHVIRRELRTKPGEMYDQSQLVRSLQELAQTGQFNPETIGREFKVNEEEGNVDIIYKLESKANDQVELSFGWGNTGVIGQLGFKFSNFAIQNLFKTQNRKGIIPQGEGQTFRISAQTNGVYYQSYSVSFLEPWFGGKRPNSLSINAHYTYQTDVSSRYYNSSNNLYYYNYLNNNYNSDYSSNMAAMESDPNKYIRLFGVSVGSGRRLSWPDDFFTFYTELAYQNYKLSNWQYFLITDGSCHNINLNFTLGRNSVFNPIYPRDGSTFSLSLQATPPYSLFDGKDYSDPNMSNKEKFQFIEYHKWKFLSKTYTSLSKNEKLVLMTRSDFGFVGYYNKNKKSPFETFSVGGDGMTGYGSTYAVETVGLRGYENGSLTSKGYGNAYSRLALELRYPIMLSNASNIYALGFVEAGNAWTSFKSFNPFDLKRSAGIGLRIMLPMVGMLGIDFGYGFDKINGSYDNSKWQPHFVIGQEF